MPSLLAVPATLKIGVLISTPLLAASVSIAPKYSAVVSLLMCVPSDNCFALLCRFIIRFMHCPLFNRMLYYCVLLSMSLCRMLRLLVHVPNKNVSSAYIQYLAELNPSDELVLLLGVEF
jgi:hypothetical protein